MLTRFVRIQLIVFGLVTVLAVGYAAFAYAGLPKLVGIGRYPATVELPSAGGLYDGAHVTLRGTEIGEVTRIRLTRTGAAADVSLDDSVTVPSDATAQIRSTSAIGEQYIELMPGHDPSARPLGEGGIVPVTRVTVPVPINDVLDSADRLVRSVPQDRLRITIDELGKAFSGTGDDLQRLLDSSGALVVDAQTNLPPTVSLIDDLRPVLTTQRSAAPDIRSYFSDLAAFTGRIHEDDPALRGTLEKMPGFAGELNDLFDDLRPTLPVLLANLTSAGQVVETYLPNVEHALVVLPAVVNDTQTAVFNNRGVPTGTALDFRATLNDPPACLEGFDGHIRDPLDVSPKEPLQTSYCKKPKDAPEAPRGAREDPCPNNPAIRSPDAAGCGLNFQSPQEVARRQKAEADPVATDPGTGSVLPEGVPYDPLSGMFFGPNGTAYSLGDSTRRGEVPSTWKSLFSEPLGIPKS